jgi:hypothetical protein
MDLLNEEDQEFLYKILKNDAFNKKTLCDDYRTAEKLHKLNLIRKIKMKHTRELQCVLTDDGLVIAVVVARLKGDYRLNRNFAIGYW